VILSLNYLTNHCTALIYIYEWMSLLQPTVLHLLSSLTGDSMSRPFILIEKAEKMADNLYIATTNGVCIARRESAESIYCDDKWCLHCPSRERGLA
jgi:hypothetical protein